MLLSLGASLCSSAWPFRSRMGINMKLHSSQETFTYKEKYFNVPVNHFDNRVSITALFPMKYLLDEQYYDPNDKNPCILFYAGNEAPIGAFWANTGFIRTDLAKALKCSVIYAEHRYYGASWPFGDEKTSQ